MQPNEFKTLLVRQHYIMALEGTNNLVFGMAHTVPLSDQNIIFNEKIRQAMGWPDSIRTMYDYRNRIPAIYNRMFQLSIISLCSDVEFFFKGLFELKTMPRPKDRGFFQRFEQVISTLSKHGLTFPCWLRRSLRLLKPSVFGTCAFIILVLLTKNLQRNQVGL